MALHTIVEHDTTHIKPYIDNVKQALSNEVIKRQRLNTKNILPFNGIMIGNTTATSAPPSGFLANITLKQGDEIVFTCNQDSALTSNTRNTLLIDPPNGTPLTRKYEDGAITTDYHNAAGLHIIRYTATEDGEYGFYLWTHTLSSAITYSKFMVCFASDYDVDSTYSDALPNSQLLSYKDNGVLGAKNYLKNTATSGNNGSGISWVVNADKTLTITKSDASTANIGLATSAVTFPKGTYKISGTPSDGDYNNKYAVFVAIGGTTIATDATNTLGLTDTFTVTDETQTYYVRIIIRTGSGTFTNLVFKPMIRLATDSDTTYQPYAMTNKELTDELTPQTLTYSVETYGGTIKATKIGKLVTVQGNGIGATQNITTEGWYLLATLPTGWRPNNNINVLGFCSGDNHISNTKAFSIGTAGNLGTYKYDGENTITNGLFIVSFVVD